MHGVSNHSAFHGTIYIKRQNSSCARHEGLCGSGGVYIYTHTHTHIHIYIHMYTQSLLTSALDGE
jgi:hypothetical protein